MQITLIGTEWCAPCKVAKQSLAGKCIDYRYVDGDSQEGIDLASTMRARSFPVLILEHDELPTQVFTGQDAVVAVWDL